jgi:hypothetical protein
MSLINFPILYIPDPVKGRPLFNGQIYVGQPDLDPTVVINQKQLNVIQENGTVVPVAQPFVLSAGGVPVYNDKPVRLDVDGNYSIKILSKLGAQVYYIENVFEGQPVTELDLINDLSITYNFATVEGYKDFATAFPISKKVYLADRDAGFTVIAGTLAATGNKIIASTLLSQSITLTTNTEVSTIAFGLVGDDIVDDTTALNEMLDDASTNAYKIISSTGKTYKYTGTAKRQIANRVRLDFGNSIIKFTASSDGHILLFNSGLTADNLIIDGDNNYFCTSGGREYAPIWCTGDTSEFNNVRLQNYLGLEERAQYGIQVDFGFNTIWNNCSADNILGTTNTAGTTGFCGAVFVTNDGALPTVIPTEPTEHTFTDCTYTNIRTTPNGAAVLFPDSDAIRLFIYDYATLTAAQQEVIELSRLTIQQSTFYNVLKSGAKIPYVDFTVRDSTFTVDNLSGHTSVFSAFRQQVGPRLTAENITVSGLEITNAVLSSGDSAYIRNITFNSDYVNAEAVNLGGNAAMKADIEGLFLNDCAFAATVTTSKEVRIKGIYDLTGSAIRQGLIRYVTATDVYLSDVQTESDCQIAIPNNASSTINGLYLSDSNMVTAETSELIDNPQTIERVELDNCNISGGFNQILSTGIVNNFVWRGGKITATGDTSRVINLDNAVSVVIDYPEIIDNRADSSDYLVFIGSAYTDIRGIDIDSSPTLYASLVSVFGIDGLSQTTGIAHVDDLSIKGSIVNKQGLAIVDTVHTRVDRIDLNYTTSRIALTNTGQTIVGWLSGKLSGSPLASSGTTVLNETAGTRVTY